MASYVYISRRKKLTGTIHFMHLVSYFNIFAIDLKKLVTLFKRDEFDYGENFYSIALWKPILLSLFPQSCQSRGNSVYRRLIGIIQNYVLISLFKLRIRATNLFVELAKDHLIQPIVNPQDEDKVCYFDGEIVY